VALGIAMKASLLLIAALLFLCGISFFRQARQRTDADGAQAMFLGLLCWVLAAIFAVIAVLAIAHHAH
jgi:hypothetical protein